VGPELFLIAATASKVVGALQAGRSEKRAAEYNAAVDERNAKIVKAQTAADVERQRRAALRRAGSLRASFGSTGFAFEGSALDLMEDNAMEEELDILTIQYSGDLKARGLMDSAALSRQKGDEAVTASYWKAGTALLSGASDYYAGIPSSGGSSGGSASGGSGRTISGTQSTGVRT